MTFHVKLDAIDRLSTWSLFLKIIDKRSLLKKGVRKFRKLHWNARVPEFCFNKVAAKESEICFKVQQILVTSINLSTNISLVISYGIDYERCNT